MPSPTGSSGLTRSILVGASMLAIFFAMLAVPGSASAVTAARQATADSSLSCRYMVVSEWSGGFVAEIVCTNTGSGPIAGWEICWTWPGGQQLTGGWSGNFSQSGANVTVTNASYNGTVAAGGSVVVGFTATGSAPPSLPITCPPSDPGSPSPV
jgi:cellulase/cellobiase CelA1